MDRYRLPENFLRLWSAHDELLPWALEKLEETKYLQDHVEFISVYMDGVKFTQGSNVRSERHTALCGLFMRSFEMLSLGLRSTFTGSYQIAAMTARDLLETSFLIDFLMDRDGEPEKWLAASITDIRSTYSPASVRKYLDKRDGFTERKRKAHFDVLSTLGAHPTPYALNLRRDGQKLIQLGPFKQSDLLQECLEELAKCTLSLFPRLLSYVDELPNSQSMFSILALRQQKSYELYFSGSSG